MDEIPKIIKTICEMSPAILLAMLGGIVRMVQEKRGGVTFCFVLGGLVSSGFVAIIVSLLLSGVDAPSCLEVALVGMSGYSYGEILSILKRKVLKKIGSLDEEDEEEKSS